MKLDGRLLLWVLGLGTTALAPFLPHISHGSDRQSDQPYLSGPTLLFSQALVLAVLVIAMMLLLGPTMRRLRLRSLDTPDLVVSGPSARVALAAALFTAAGIVSAVLSNQGRTGAMALVGPLLFATLYLTSHQPFPQLLGQLRIILRCYVYGSLLSIVLMPHDWAFLLPGDGGTGRDYLGTGWGQLMGLSGNPNALGPLAATALLLEVCSVARRGMWPLHAAAALFTLLLTQSRTAWVAAAAVVFLHIDPRHTVRKAAVLTVGGAALAVTALLPGTQAQLLATVADPQFAEANGRTLAWRLAWEEFLREPLFGYGPNLFDPAHRLQLFGTEDSWIGQAHNQVLHTMGSAGLFGLLGLTALLVTMTFHARRTSADTKGLSVALVALFLVSCATESPLRNLSGLSDRVLFVVVIWCVLVARPHADTSGPDAGISGPRTDIPRSTAGQDPPTGSDLPRPASSPLERPCPAVSR
ncbi:O-antigen ligase family protein [Streptomyces sp. TRM66268-LWL]|uniref:O-antigen ligase family protein n=1 Tax=Streptomyces polyasparticus TaxID=2767826 RepID=A0ABR7SG00_9ACTN|nr:O-antigen ligase family protein [Streptomyces polyasparticus]MBC9714426.1 O-antigen ligase family protein [Streptomyces polyasparticus]